MSSTIYNKALEVELTHDFYAYDDAPQDNEFKINKQLEIVPTVECAELLRNGRMRFVRTGQGFVLFYQAYVDPIPTPAEKPFVKLNDGSEFVFVMRMPTDAMPLLTNVSDWNVGSKTYSADKLFMLQAVVGNTSNPESIMLTDTLANSIKPPIFTYSFGGGGYTSLVDVVVFDDATPTPNEVFRLDDVPYNTDTQSYTVTVNLTGKPKGFYTFKAFQANTTTPVHTTDFYLDANLIGQNVFGVIRIKYNDIDRLYDATSVVSPVTPLDFKTFTYAFAARSVYWRYYIVGKDLDTAFFTANDLGVIKSGVTFYASYPSPWMQENGAPDPTIKVNGFDTVILTSQSKIAFSENAQLGFNLKKYPKPSGPFATFIDNISNANVIGVDSDQYAVAYQQTSVPDIAEIYVIV